MIRMIMEQLISGYRSRVPYLQIQDKQIQSNQDKKIRVSFNAHSEVKQMYNRLSLREIKKKKKCD